jgi:Cytochrome C'
MEIGMNKVHMWMTVAVLAALGLAYVAGPTSAGGEDDPRGVVERIAAAVKKGDMDGAKKMAGAYAKKAESVEEVMDLFKTKKKGGIGFGNKPTDGIESKYREVARDGAKGLSADASKYENMAYITVAIGLIAEAKVPEKDAGKKLRKTWLQSSQDMQEGALALAKAAKSKTAADVKTAAARVNAACNACHSDFRN